MNPGVAFVLGAGGALILAGAWAIVRLLFLKLRTCRNSTWAGYGSADDFHRRP